MNHLVWLLGAALLVAGCGVSSTAGGGNSSAPPTQAVTIITDQKTYHSTDAIQATIENRLGLPIYAHDTAASCSILILQQQVQGVWQSSDMAGCPMKRSAMLVTIAAGATVTATITASYPGLPPAKFPQGTYRLVLPYATSSKTDPTGQSTQMITSMPFSVNG